MAACGCATKSARRIPCPSISLSDAVGRSRILIQYITEAPLVFLGAVRAHFASYRRNALRLAKREGRHVDVHIAAHTEGGIEHAAEDE
eukprot:6287938-Prymnesium_polylepis.2